MEKTVPFSELEDIVRQLSVDDRWQLLKLLISLLQPPTLPISQTAPSPDLDLSQNERPFVSYYGCLDDETFIRHPQPEQPDREPLL